MPRKIEWPTPLPPRGRGKPSAERLAQEAEYEEAYKRAKSQQDNRDKLAASKPPKEPKPIRATARKTYEHTFSVPQQELESLSIYAPLSIKQEKYLNDEENDIVVWGGAAAAGKTQLTLLKIMLAATWDKNFVGGIARKSQKQMKAAGSLWSSGVKQMTVVGARTNSLEMTWNFPNGAEVKCHHLDNNQDDWQGTQMTKCCVDEAQQCTEDDIWYLTTRLRSQSAQKAQLLLTCNPLNTSFLCDWLVKAGYLLESGTPDPERDGQTTYMVQMGGAFEWFKSRKELVAMYGEEVAKVSLKFVFYSANVYDNPWIRKHQPQYVHKLEQAKAVERERLLLGNWFAQVEGLGFIKREQLQEIALSDIPFKTARLRAWDFAATKPHPANTNPDWTRGLLATYDKETQRFYVLDMVSIRDSAAMVQSLVEETCRQDGKDTYVCIPVDPGGAGKANAEQRKARLEALGYKVVLELARKGKLSRAETFILACQEGRVFVAPGVFKEDHYKEIESFDGGKCGGLHDDIIDSLSSAYTQLTTGYLIPTIRLNHSTDIRRSRLGGRTLLQ